MGVEIENLSKKYCRSLLRGRYYLLTDIAREIFLLRGSHKLRRGEFWALNNINLKVSSGETLGIVGPNGSGKTTLLKSIYGILKPNAGHIRVEGRVGSLLSLGAGLAPLLSGRENIKLMLTMQHLNKSQIRGALDEIIAFSELADVIDSPVNTYSSGMIARLAFSATAHAYPDILLLDEVLAVGDLAFVNKCYKKIREFQLSGGTIILVSHNLYNIRANCSRAIELKAGQLVNEGKADDVCDLYQKRYEMVVQKEEYILEGFRIAQVKVPQKINSGDPFTFSLTFESPRDIANTLCALVFYDGGGNNLFSNVSLFDHAGFKVVKGSNTVEIHYEGLALNRGRYFLNFCLAEGDLSHQLIASNNLAQFEVENEDSNLGSGFFRLRPQYRFFTEN